MRTESGSRSGDLVFVFVFPSSLSSSSPSSSSCKARPPPTSKNLQEPPRTSKNLQNFQQLESPAQVQHDECDELQQQWGSRLHFLLSSAGGGGSFRSSSMCGGGVKGGVKMSPLYAGGARSGSGSGSGAWAWSGFGGGAFGAEGGHQDISANEKAALQSLNVRLAAFLEKVRRLEEGNGEMESRIRDFLDQKTCPSTGDYSAPLSTVQELQAQILEAAMVNAHLFRAIDDAKLTADDFKSKYETELTMRQSVEADIAGLRMMLGELGMAKADLSLQIDALKDDLVTLKKNHEEDLLLLRSQMSGQVNVEVDAAPQEDLTKVMAEIREHYEAVAAKNQRDLEGWFHAKSEALSKEVATTEMTLKSSTSEIKEVKSTLQALEIELQSMMSMKASLEMSLSEIQARYAAQLSGFQMKVGALEGQLVGVRADLERQGQEYSMLLDIKTRLELEIAEYRRLLEGESSSSSSGLNSGSGSGLGSDSGSGSSSGKTKQKVVTIIQEMVDGQVVSSTSTETILDQD
ncbi:keratin, type I cytoskeletal 13-like [Boleophthalmus pectinirostris]|uniref:keratin, type I cytoskeletal 13-like n=1 Tax=Boleophthalmus pectinirostris TaxID=150288 RepID=UPI0024321364|nr:keratin, type I cytoskeletal 13-like [Boleophthalmus pectinirostris]